MSKYEKTGIGLALLAVIGVVFILFQISEKKVSRETLGGVSTIIHTYLNNNSATTSTTHLNDANATTTFPFNIANAERIDLNIQLESTTTIPTLVWFYEYANGCANYVNCDWFHADGLTVNSEIQSTHGASPHIHYWTPAATTTDGELWLKNIEISPIASQLTRINFNVVGADTNIWVDAAVKTDVK